MKIQALDIQIGDVVNDVYQCGQVVDLWNDGVDDSECPYITIRTQNNVGETIDEIYGPEDYIKTVPSLPPLAF